MLECKKIKSIATVICYLLQLWSDFVYGSCIDGFLKSQAGDCEPGDHDCPSVYMYLFTHRSEFEPLPFWMGKNLAVCCLCETVFEDCVHFTRGRPAIARGCYS